MAAKSDIYQQALAAHRAGKLDAAKKLYQELLQKNPQQPEVLHHLGLLAAQQGDFQKAIAQFKQAISLDSGIAVFHNNLGNALKAAKQPADAITAYQTALKLNANYAEAHNNLASIYLQQNNFGAALQHYTLAVQLQPDYLEAHVNLGLLFIKQGAIDAAIDQFNHVLQLEPQFAVAHWQLGNLYLTQNKLDKAEYHYKFLLNLKSDHLQTINNLGVVYLKQNKPEQAIAQFQKALEIDPYHPDARNNLAATLLQQDRYTEAVWNYQLYVNLAPEDAEAHYNFAVANLALDNWQEALEHFQQTIKIQPHHADAYCNIAAIYLKTNQKTLAIEYYQKALSLAPNNPAVIYMLHALRGDENPSAAPAEYIENLFNNYAGFFDQQLTENLHYKMPALMYKAIQDLLPQSKLTILDLGCGTGLSGAPFREHATRLVGVDLSERMLDKAREKNIYDALIANDIVSYLQKSNEKFDLIISADTLVYFGDLLSVLENCKKILTPQGLLMFSIELGTGENYQLQTNGRYSHNKKYIEQLAAQLNFTILTAEQVVGRTQQEQPVQGMVFILKS